MFLTFFSSYFFIAKKLTGGKIDTDRTNN